MEYANISNYLREEAFPSIWCPGCGHGIITKAALRAISRMGWKKDDIIAVSGIGCSSRAPSYCDFNSIQTTHGRAIAFATGMALNRPDLHVILFLGDGDCSAIGGNHLIHAAKRNINMTVIVMNNHIYGMTGGQTSPTTHYMDITTTSPYGNIEPELDICGVSAAAGATFVARTTAFHVNQLADLIERGLKNKGFSLVECISPCPTGYGRRNKMKNPVTMYNQLKEKAISVEKAASMPEETVKNKIVTGVLKSIPRTDFNSEYQSLLNRLKEAPHKDSTGLVLNNTDNITQFQKKEIRLAGSGGQGLIMSGIVLAETAIRYGINGTHTQSYGPEARGGASRSEVILSKDEICYPEVKNPDILLAMNQQSFDNYAASVKPGGIIIADTTYVKDLSAAKEKVVSYPLTESIIDRFGSALCANMAALGMLAAHLKEINIELFKESISARVPKAFTEMNLDAFLAGYRWAETVVAKV